MVPAVTSEIAPCDASYTSVVVSWSAGRSASAVVKNTRAPSRDAANSLAVGGGQLDLNVMMPLLAYNLTKGPQLFLNFLPVVRTRCVDGITANVDRCRQYLEESPSVVTALTPKIGYAKAAEIFKEAVSRGVRVRQVLEEKKVLSPEELAAAMTPEALLGPLE